MCDVQSNEKLITKEEYLPIFKQVFKISFIDIIDEEQENHNQSLQSVPDGDFVCTYTKGGVILGDRDPV